MEWHCKKTGSILVRVDRFYPSTKLCSECGALLDPEKNAAINIHREGHRLFAAQYEVEHRLREEAAQDLLRQAAVVDHHNPQSFRPRKMSTDLQNVKDMP